ncbi:putative ribonuclease H-like domain-containing protein [Tanacetum coccineum]
MNVSPIPTTRIHKDHPKDQIIRDINSATQTRRMTKISKEHAMIEAMQDELLQFSLQKVWRLVDLPKGKHAIGTKWVYRNKKDERGIVVRNKARLVVAQRLQPRKRNDYDEVFAYDIIFGANTDVFMCCVEICAQYEVPDEFYGGAHFLLRVVGHAKRSWNLHQPRQVLSYTKDFTSLCSEEDL